MLQQETAALHNLDERDVVFESLQDIVRKKKGIVSKQMIAAAAFGDAVQNPQSLAQKSYELTKDFGEARFKAHKELVQVLNNMGALLDQAIREAQKDKQSLPSFSDPLIDALLGRADEKDEKIADYLNQIFPLIKKRDRVDAQMQVYAGTAEQTIQHFARYSGANAEEWRADLAEALDTDIVIPAADHPDFIDRYNENAARLARAFIGIGNSSYEMAMHNLNYIAALDAGKMWKSAAPGTRLLNEKKAENLREEVGIVRHFAENILSGVRGRTIEKKISTLNEQLILFQTVYNTASGTDANAQAEMAQAIFGETGNPDALMEAFDTACSAAAKSRLKVCKSLIGNLSALDDLLSFKRAEAFKDYEHASHLDLPLDAQTVNSDYHDMAKNLKERLVEFDTMARRDARLLNETRDVSLAPMMHSLDEALLEQINANTMVKHGNAARDIILDNLMSDYADMSTENLRSAIIWLGLVAAQKSLDIDLTEKEAEHNEQTIDSYIGKLDSCRHQVNEIAHQRLAAFKSKATVMSFVN